MAGGSGTRFWPRSRASFPKQLISLDGTETLLEGTLRRAISIASSPERVCIITNARYVDETWRQSAPFGVARDQIVPEPTGRDTAPCVGLGALLAQKYGKDAIMAVLAADHRIASVENFAQGMDIAARVALDTNGFVTLGIVPDRPAVEYGYIEQGTIRDLDGVEVAEVVRFTEKPDLATAQSFLKEGRFKWNAGIFVWKASTILDAFAKYLPEHAALLEEIRPVVGTNDFQERLASVYPKFPKISIDYGIMEKADNIHVVTAPFDWDDLGSWLALERLHNADDANNTILGEALVLDSSNVLIDAGEDGMVAAIGVQDLVVVRSGDAVLICPKSRVQDVKKLVGELEKDRLQRYL